MRRALSIWRRDLNNWLLSGGNIALLFIGLQTESVAGLRIATGLIVLTSLWAWFGNLKRYRLITDTPTSRIHTAAQGYIEICGIGRPLTNEPLLDPITHLPCLWYRYVSEARKSSSWEHVQSRDSSDRWEHVQSGESNDSFGVHDGSGLMVVDPEHAEIRCSRSEILHVHEHRHTLWTLIAGDTLYAIGQHVTLGSHEQRPDKHQQVAQRLSEWKEDRAGLLRRFDRNRDGDIDMQEWESARTAAETEASQKVVEPSGAVHLLRAPNDGRPFLIADKNVTELAHHYRRWSIVHLVAVALGAIGILALG